MLAGAIAPQRLQPVARGTSEVLQSFGRVVREAIKAAEARLLFLPRYSPDFNSIEKAFSKLKARLRKAAERTVDGLWDAVARFLDDFTPHEYANFFAAAGYDAI